MKVEGWVEKGRDPKAIKKTPAKTKQGRVSLNNTTYIPITAAVSSAKGKLGASEVRWLQWQCVRKHQILLFASAWLDKHLLQYLKSRGLANRRLPWDFELTAKCCQEEAKPGQRSEAGLATQTQTKKCYSATSVFLQHPSVSSVAVGNLTSTLEPCVCYCFLQPVELPPETLGFQKKQ